MPAVRLTSFGGELPGKEPRNIPETYAITASNVRLTSTRIDPVFSQLAEATCKSGATTIYRLHSTTWLSWVQDVDIALSPIAGDTSHKFCFTSDSFEPRTSNLALATAGTPYPYSWYVLGVTPPVTKPAVSVVGGASSSETRSYVYTFVTQWGEESAPSPASDVDTGFADGTWTVEPTDVAPPNSYTISNAVWALGTLTLTVNSTFGLRAGEYVTLSGLAPAIPLNASWKVATVTNTTTFTITMSDPGTITDTTGTATRDAPHNTTGMTKRIYRSVTTATDTQFYFVKEIPVATVTTTDDVGSAIGEALPTSGWLMPPVGLQGITTLPSGALVGFYDNVICFSEPNIPYAWPSSYRNTSDYPIVGLGTIGTAVVVGTQGTPYVIDGVEPAAATMSRINQMWPCLSKRGVVSFNNGVYYPTSIGLVYTSFNGADIVTKEAYSQYEWMDLNPDGFYAATFNNLYYTTQTTDGDNSKILVIMPNGWITEYSIQTSVIYTDKALGRVYYVDGTSIYELEPTTGVSLRYEWQSKVFVVPNPLNLGACKIDANYSLTTAEVAALAAARAALAPSVLADRSGVFNGAMLDYVMLDGQAVNYSSSPNEQIEFTLLVGDDLDVFFTKTVVSGEVFRLPAGRKYDSFSIKVVGNVPIKAIVIGETPDSLRTA